MSINLAEISGNLTRDSELRQTQSGTSVLRFTVAVNDRRKNRQTNEWEDYTNLIDCVTWGKRADKLNQYLKKGCKVSLSGKLHWSSWEKDGTKRSKVEVYVDEVEFMSRQHDAAQQVMPAASQDAAQQVFAPATGPAYTAPAPVVPAPAQAGDVYDEDIPF